jgi:uncharacterized protein YndB with AHSA1/START domain
MSTDPVAHDAQPDGTLETRGGNHVLCFQRRLDHSVERVWAALTEPEELVKWLAAAKLDLVEGGHVELRWLNTDEEGNTAISRGAITELDPPRVIEYDSDIQGLLRWELREDSNGCVLTFTNTLPANEYVARSLAGWHIHLEHLADALAGHPVNWPTWTRDYYGRWTEHHERYSAP